jgi:hypothetical protein
MYTRDIYDNDRFIHTPSFFYRTCVDSYLCYQLMWSWIINNIKDVVFFRPIWWGHSFYTLILRSDHLHDSIRVLWHIVGM